MRFSSHAAWNSLLHSWPSGNVPVVLGFVWKASSYQWFGSSSGHHHWWLVRGDFILIFVDCCVFGVSFALVIVIGKVIETVREFVFSNARFMTEDHLSLYLLSPSHDWVKKLSLEAMHFSIVPHPNHKVWFLGLFSWLCSSLVEFQRNHCMHSWFFAKVLRNFSLSIWLHRRFKWQLHSARSDSQHSITTLSASVLQDLDLNLQASYFYFRTNWMSY